MKIILSGKELAQSGLSCRDFDSDSPEAASLISKLVGAVYLRKGLPVPGQRLFAEVFPTSGKGCVVYISSVDGSLFPETGTIVLITDSTAALTQAAKLIQIYAGKHCTSSLYADSSSFKLTIELDEDIAPLTERLRQTAAVAPANECILAHITEHCRTIIPENAVDTLSELTIPS